MRRGGNTLGRFPALAIGLCLVLSGCSQASTASPTLTAASSVAPTAHAVITPSPTVTPASTPIPVLTLQAGNSYFSIDGTPSFILSRNPTGKTQSDFDTVLEWARQGGTKVIRVHVIAGWLGDREGPNERVVLPSLGGPRGRASGATEYSHSAGGPIRCGRFHGCRRVPASHGSGYRDSKLGGARLSPGGRPGSGDHLWVVGANLCQLAGVESRQRCAARRSRRAGSLSRRRRPPGWLILVPPNPRWHQQAMVLGRSSAVNLAPRSGMFGRRFYSSRRDRTAGWRATSLTGPAGQSVLHLRCLEDDEGANPTLRSLTTLPPAEAGPGP